MRRTLPLILTLFVLLPLSAVLAACGGVPGNAVAEVDGEAIEKTEFDSWMTVAASAGGQANAALPKPPNYTECIAAKRKALPEPTEDQPAVSDEDLKDQCRQEYESIRDNVMRLLINSAWIAGEAQEQDVEVTDEEVRKAFDTQKEQQFPKEKDYEAFLEQSGQTEEQLLAQVRTGELGRKISEKVVEGQDSATDAEVKTYYEENKERFARPETRDAHVVLTRTRARAEEALAALESGDSWRSVARRYSIDEASKQAGGALEDIAEGTQDSGLDRALFRAEQGEIVGPVKTSLGYYVLEVDDVTKASQQTLEDSRDTIRQALIEEKKQKTLQEFVEEYEKEWREKTECRDGYRVPGLCENAPEPEASPTPAAPEGAAPPPAEQTPPPAEQD